jgi:BRCA1-associated protein 2
MPSPSYFFHIGFDLYRPSRRWLDDTTGIRWATAKKIEECLTQRLCRSGALLEFDDLHPPHPPVDAEDARQDLASDWRAGQIVVQSFDPTKLSRSQPKDKVMSEQPSISQGGTTITNTSSETVPAAPSGARFGNSLRTETNPFATKGRFEPLSTLEEGLGWGIVRLYRDKEETPGLYEEVSTKASGRYGRSSTRHEEGDTTPSFKDEDCNTLCILAVPSYITPADFLGFVGEKTREDVSLFHMIRTDRINRYMVLMKFRSGKKAREWQKEWNGKPFDDLEVCG